jgi:hypothetical protein
MEKVMEKAMDPENLDGHREAEENLRETIETIRLEGL